MGFQGVLFWLLCVAVLLLASPVSADDEPAQATPSSAESRSGTQTRSGATTVSSRTTAPSPSTGATSAVRDPRFTAVPRGGLLSTWNTTRKRWFVSARADVGFLFFRPRVSVGYGIPHQAWTGFDLVPIVSSAQGGLYAGPRYRHPRFEIRSGMLYSGAFFRGYLEPRSSYDGRDLELRAGRTATFWAWDTELKLTAPLGSGYLESETQSLYVLGTPDDRYVFAETMGVVVAPPWAIRQQLRYLFPVPRALGLFLGPVVEAVLVPNRDEMWVWRAGISARFRLYQDLQLRTDVLPTVYSPDTFGRQGSSWLTINARFFWASN